MKTWNKKQQTLSFHFFANRFSILMFFVLFFRVVCKTSNFNKWTAKHLAQASCTELTLRATLGLRATVWRFKNSLYSRVGYDGASTLSKQGIFFYWTIKKRPFLMINSYLALTPLGFEPGLVALYVEGLQGQWHRARQHFWGLEEPILKI